MTVLWATFLEVFQVGLFWLTQFYGGHLASAIISFSILARVALLPLTVRLSLRARAHARKVRALQPELLEVRERWKESPERVATETLAVYQRHQVSPIDTGVLKGSFAQTPIFVGLYHAVRGALNSASGDQAFLWLSSLSRPDLGVAMVVCTLVGMSTAAGATESQPAWALSIPALGAGAIALMMSAGFGLYLAATGLVGALQGLIVRRIEDGARG